MKDGGWRMRDAGFILKLSYFHNISFTHYLISHLSFSSISFSTYFILHFFIFSNCRPGVPQLSFRTVLQGKHLTKIQMMKNEAPLLQTILFFRWQMSDVGCQMSDVRCRMSDVGCRMSDVRREIWDVRRETWDVRRETWDMRCEMWDMRCEMWEILLWSVFLDGRFLPLFTFPFFLFLFTFPWVFFLFTFSLALFSIFSDCAAGKPV